MRFFSPKNITVLCFLLAFGILALSVRGLPGNPAIEELNTDYWTEEGPLELSPERGRFALLYSLMEDGSPHFSLPVAQLATPDLAHSEEGNYVSMFAPGVSYLVVPGYAIGKFLGHAQAGTYMLVALITLANMIFIRKLALHMGAREGFALLGALAYGFATPAFAYGVNLYQHNITVFLLLSALYALLRYPTLWGFAYIWFASTLSVVVDNPNIFLMFPLGLYALGKLLNRSVVSASQHENKRFRLSWRSLLTFFAILPPLFFFFWYNEAAYGNPLQLPGTLRGVDEIGPDGKPATINTYEQELGIVHIPTGETTKEKTAIGFFETRNLYDGFYSHFVSRDRGMVFFTPVILLGLVGLFFLYQRNAKLTGLFLSLIAVNILTYSMWADPQGGWAFGSRYLIPSYSLLAIGIALALSWAPKPSLALAVFVPLFIFSLSVNTLGAVTSSANPPKVEVLSLEEQSGHEQKYTFLRNWEFLHQKYERIGSKSFVYQAWAKKYVSAPVYYTIVLTLAFLTALLAFSLEILPRYKKL